MTPDDIDLMESDELRRRLKWAWEEIERLKTGAWENGMIKQLQHEIEYLKNKAAIQKKRMTDIWAISLEGRHAS